MNRSDVLRKISALTRRQHGCAIWALGYVLLDLPTGTLEDLLEGLEEFSDLPAGLGHLEAYRERYGRTPGGSN